jgi:hypothetical protein
LTCRARYGTGYDTVRYQYLNKLPFKDAPEDDRLLPDLCLGLYRDVVVFDSATKQMFAVHWVDTTVFDGDVEAALDDGEECLDHLVRAMQPQSVPSLPFGEVSMARGVRGDGRGRRGGSIPAGWSSRVRSPCLVCAASHLARVTRGKHLTTPLSACDASTAHADLPGV